MDCRDIYAFLGLSSIRDTIPLLIFIPVLNSWVREKCRVLFSYPGLFLICTPPPVSIPPPVGTRVSRCLDPSDTAVSGR